jgi:hypothetical protein
MVAMNLPSFSRSIVAQYQILYMCLSPLRRVSPFIRHQLSLDRADPFSSQDLVGQGESLALRDGRSGRLSGEKVVTARG